MMMMMMIMVMMMIMMIMMVLLFLSIPAFVALIRVSKAMQDSSRNIRDSIYTINRDFTTATQVFCRDITRLRCNL